MADDLEEVRQVFVADMAGYIEPIDEAAAETERLKAEIRGVGLDSDEAFLAGSQAAGEYRDKIAGTWAAVHELDDEIAGLRDKSAETATTVKFLDDAMKKTRDDSAAAAEAASFLGLSLDATSDIAKKARDRLLELGFSEREAAAGARKLAEAQTAADAAIAAGGGGGLAGLFESAGGLGGAMGSAGALAGGVALVPVIAAVVTEVMALVSGFAAAGAGVAAFAALAYPALHSIASGYTTVSTAQQKVRADQIKLNDAEAIYNKSPTKANLAAQKTALNNLAKAQQDVRTQWKAMDPAQRDAVRGIEQLKTTYEGMAKAFAPDAFKVFDAGLKIANELLPDLKPVADAATPAIDKLLGKLEKFFQPAAAGGDTMIGNLRQMGSQLRPPPTGWQSFLASFEKLEGPAITAIGQGLGKVAGQMGNLLTKFSAKDVVNSINIAFQILSLTIGGLTRMIDNAMRGWAETTAGAKAMRNWFDNATRSVQRFSDNLSIWYRDAERDINRFNADLSGWARDAEKDYDRVSGDVKNWKNDVVRDMTDAGHDIESVWDSAAGKVERTTQSLISRVTGAFKSLPGKLFGLGEQAIDGLIHGIESKFGVVEGAIEHLAGLIPSGLSAVLHMLSPSLVMRERGQMAVAGLVAGLMDGEGAVLAAMAHIGAVVAGPGGGGRGVLPGGYVPAAAAGAGGSQLQLATNVTVQLNNQTLLRATQTASRTWNRRNVTNSLTLRTR